jgi:hypothetical protein
VVQKDVLDKVPGERVAAFVVWVPMLEDDSRDAAVKATKLLGDRRARHFWDPDKKVAHVFAKMLQSTFGEANKLPKIEYPAWDVYLVFDRAAAWKEKPPVPVFWMHQLRGIDESIRLDGPRLREAVKKATKKDCENDS